MRITGGTHGGRLLQSPKDRSIRPTSDKVRLALFNILNARGLVNDAVVLDAFCGTGALGLEALSHGALCCIFIDKNRQSLDLARDNFAALKMDSKHYFILKDAIKITKRPHDMPPATLIFLDPPYNQGLIEQSIFALQENGWMDDDAHILAECEKGLNVAVSGFEILMVRDYGDTTITLLKKMAVAMVQS